VPLAEVSVFDGKLVSREQTSYICYSPPI